MNHSQLRKVAVLLALVAILNFIIGCSPATPQPELTSTDIGTEVPPENATDENGGGVASDVSTAVSGRTPVPTPTVRPIVQEIDNLAGSLGLSGQTFLGLTTEDWINLAVSGLIIFGGYLAANLIVNTLLRRLVKRTSTQIDNEFLSAIEKPLNWLIVVFVSRFAVLRLGFLNEGLRTFLDDVFFIGLLVLSAIIGARLINFYANWYIGTLKSDADPERLTPVITIIQRVGYVFLFIFTISIGLIHFGLDITVLAALLLLAGVLLALGARDLVANAVSGFLILIDQPFRVGDNILIQDLDTWGDVLEIGTRLTRIRTRDNREVIVPNATINQGQVTNYSYPDPRFRVETQIGIAYGSDFDQVRRVINEAVRGVDGVLPDKLVSIYFVGFGDSARQMKVLWWVDSRAEKNPSLDRVNEALELALGEAGIVMPNNTLDLNVSVDSPEAEDKHINGKETTDKD